MPWGESGDTDHRCDYVVTDMTASGRGSHGLKALYRVECKHCGHSVTGFADDIPRATFR